MELRAANPDVEVVISGNLGPRGDGYVVDREMTADEAERSTTQIRTLDQPGPWHRLRGIRANASTMSHAELDEATELDRGDERQLAAGYLQIAARLPAISVVGGCCGNDLGHLREIAAVMVPVAT